MARTALCASSLPPHSCISGRAVRAFRYPRLQLRRLRAGITCGMCCLNCSHCIRQVIVSCLRRQFAQTAVKSVGIAPVVWMMRLAPFAWDALYALSARRARSLLSCLR